MEKSEESEPQTLDMDESALEGWSKEDKFYLLQGFKYYGASDIESIQEEIPSKSAEQIVAAIKYYKKKATLLMSHDNRKGKERSAPTTVVPLAMWAKHLTESRGFAELQTDCARALDLLADVEDRPSHISTNHIDFKGIYKFIANGLEGKPITQKDAMTAVLLEKCLTETAVLARTFMTGSHFRYILECIELTKNDINVFPTVWDDHEQVAVQHLAAQINYNPLRIKEDNLKSSNPY